MHLLGENRRRGRRNRTDAESLFKSINNIVMLIQLACLLVVISMTSIAARKTFESQFWFPGDYQLNEVIDTKTENCTFTSTRTVWSFPDVEVTMNHENQARMWGETSFNIKMIILIWGFAIGVGSLNKALYNYNVWFAKMHYFVVHKEILTTLEIALLIFGFYRTIKAEPLQKMLREWIEHCDITTRQSIAYISFTPLYIGFAIVMAAHVLAAIILLYNTVCKAKAREKEPMNDESEVQNTPRAAPAAMPPSSFPIPRVPLAAANGMNVSPHRAPPLRTAPVI